MYATKICKKLKEIDKFQIKVYNLNISIYEL